MVAVKQKTVRKNGISESDFHRINNDTNGNPRYVIHFLQLAPTYEQALKIGKKLGGRKFHNKQYGGGIVFQTYDLNRLIERMESVRQNPSKKGVKNAGVADTGTRKRNATAADFGRFLFQIKNASGKWVTENIYSTRMRAVDELENMVREGDKRIKRVIDYNTGKVVASSSPKRNATAANPEIMGRYVSEAVLDNVLQQLTQYYQSSTKDKKTQLPVLIRYLELKVGLLPRQAKSYISVMEKHLMPKRNATAADFKQHQKSRLQDLAAMFQGTANGEKRRVLESDYAPKDKYRLGYLVQMKIKDAGKTIPIDFDGESYLAGDLRNNLWVVGKDAKITNIKLPPKGQLKYLGELIQVDYVTAKKHIEGGKTVRFYHKLGEVTKETPNLFIDDEGFPIIVSGGYDVWNVGIVN